MGFYAAADRKIRVRRADRGGGQGTVYRARDTELDRIVAVKMINQPVGVALASDGSGYVADSGSNRIQKITLEGVFVSKWGTEGTGDVQFVDPHGVAVASDGSVYVTDWSNARIQKFSVGP